MRTEISRAKLLLLVMEELGTTSLSIASLALNNSVYPNFYCVNSPDEYNATLTFITGDSYKVKAEPSKVETSMPKFSEANGKVKILVKDSKKTGEVPSSSRPLNLNDKPLKKVVSDGGGFTHWV